jgi:ubiquinone/menaquinone biosynthesis C-methylase UbiE
MGFFTLPLATLVGPTGRTIGVDLQPEMIDALHDRARKAGLDDRLETRVCTENNLQLDDLCGQIDFALAFYMVHEVPNAGPFFVEIAEALRSGGRLLLAEPKLHVSEDRFRVEVKQAEEAGCTVATEPRIRGSRTVLLEKKVE